MQPAKPPKNEQQRLEALYRYLILDSSAEQSYDEITKLATTICETPIALISLVDNDRQWFKSKVGLDANQTPRDLAFCAHAILEPNKILEVADTFKDKRFADNPLVTGDPKIRFYAGMPLQTTTGEAIGTLCVIDRKPSSLTPLQKETLRVLGNQVMIQLELRYMLLLAAENKNHISAIVNNVVDGIITINANGTIESFNPSAERIFGYKKTEVVGKNVSFLMADPYNFVHDGYLKDYIDKNKKKNIGSGSEVAAKRKDGNIFPMELSVSAFEDAGKKMFVFSIHDITEKKQLISNLEGQITAINKSQAVIEFNMDGTILTANQNFLSITGYQLSQIKGKHHSIFVEPFYKDSNEYKKFWKSLQAGEHQANQFKRIGKGGRELWIQGCYNPILDENGKPFKVVKFATNITERKITEARLQEYAEKKELVNFELEVAKNDAEDANRLKGEFISVVSHELRTPLTSIRGSLGLIIGAFSKDLPEKVSGLIEIAHNNCERLILLINDILDMDKIAAGQMRFDIKNEVLEDITNKAVVANKAYAEMFNTCIMWKSIDTSIMVNLDSDRYIQVLSNLLSNAAKFSSKGKNIDVTAVQTDGNIRISVRDYGEGIPEEFRSKIFGKFLQADSSGTRSNGGTGLGLHITKQIVEQMGGSIGFDTETNIGTTFWVEFPILGKQVKAIKKIKYNDDATVLICEDTTDVARVMRVMLENAGFKSDVSYNIADARNMLKNKQYEAVTIGNQFPDGDGGEFVKELRSNPDTKNLPIVLVLDNKSSKILDIDSNLEINAWIKKPIDEKILVKAIQDAITSIDYLPEVLHVEDDLDLSKLIATALSGKVKVTNASTLKQAKNLLKRKQFSTIILDMGLPDGSGQEILDFLPIKERPPVMVLSADQLPDELRSKVSEAIVKSKVSETKIIETILYLVENNKGKK